MKEEDTKPEQIVSTQSFFWQDALKITLFALAYFMAHHISFYFPDPKNVLMVIWPAGGVGLAALLLTRRQLWPIIIVALFAVGNIANLSVGRPIFNSIGFMMANVLESLGSAKLIIFMCGNKVHFTRVIEITALICAAIMVNTVTSFIGAGTAAMAHIAPFWSFWKTWWVADGLGLLLITPLLVTWLNPQNLTSKPQWGRVIEWGLFFTLWCVVAWLTFQIHTVHAFYTLHPYVLFALLAWAALRFGQREVSIALCLLAALAVNSEAVSSGPLPWGGATYTDRLMQMQLYLSFIAVTGFFLAASYSEAKSSEQQALEGHDSLCALGDNLPNGMVYQVVIEPDYSRRFLYVSAAVERIYGVSVDAVLHDPETLYRLIDIEDWKAFVIAEKEAIRNFTIFKAIFRIHRADGMLRWMYQASSPRHLADERFVFDGIQVDITEQKQAEEMLQREKDFSESLIKTAQTIILVLNPEGRIIRFNSYLEEISGFTLEEVQGKDWFTTFLPKRDQQSIRLVFSHAMSGVQTCGNINPIVTKDGQELEIEWNDKTLKDANGKVTGLLVTGQDITERKRVEGELHKYADTQAILVQEINHRVKNNLTAIISMLHQEEDRAVKEGMTEYMSRLQAVVGRVAGLLIVHSLLSAREWQPMPLTQLCDNVIRGALKGTPASQVIELDIVHSDIHIDSDQAHYLTLILNELVTNTIKQAFKNRPAVHIHVLVECQDDTIILIYRDDGPGYPLAILQNEFPTTSIGFNLITGIIRKSMGGEIELLNEDGAVARITFPKIVGETSTKESIHE
ncbi:MAG: MASE1 domain-containing protein [Desulfobulbaceae bacterium]|nr:MASE1 domain-containing protein [Desulfobulbaceae bacterium]